MYLTRQYRDDRMIGAKDAHLIHFASNSWRYKSKSTRGRSSWQAGVSRAWSFCGKKDGKGGAIGGDSRKFCTICGMILTSSYENPGPLSSHRQHCEGWKGKGGTRSGKTDYTSRSALLIRFFGPLLDYSCACAEGRKAGGSVHNIISPFPCKAGVVSCPYSSIYID